METHRTVKRVACDLKPGDVFAAALVDSGPFAVTNYTVVEVVDNEMGSETMTVRVAYNYPIDKADGTGERVMGIRRMECVTVL